MGLRPLAQQTTEERAITYADAGVDIERANRTKQRIKYLAHKTFNRGVLSEIGGFGGLFAIDKKRYLDPVLVSSVDGVGTKLKIAFEMNLHHTIGADLVNHCVNDIAVQGAAPMFFMDYFATGKLQPDVAEKVVSGIADACKQNGCALIGGETAEMPGFYDDGEYDLAGFIVGVVDRPKIITGKDVQAGDVLIGLPSTGLHTNGYSLARKLFFEVARYTPDSYVNEIKGKVGTELMRTHKSYWPIMRRMMDAEAVSAMAHITGGGITENLPRVLPKGMGAIVEIHSWPVLPIFQHMQAIGNVPAGRHAAHLQHGHRHGPGGSVQQVQEGADHPRALRRKGLHHRPYRQRRAPRHLPVATARLDMNPDAPHTSFAGVGFVTPTDESAGHLGSISVMVFRMRHLIAILTLCLSAPLLFAAELSGIWPAFRQATRRPHRPHCPRATAKRQPAYRQDRTPLGQSQHPARIGGRQPLQYHRTHRRRLHHRL